MTGGGTGGVESTGAMCPGCVLPLCMNGTNTAGITESGNHDLPFSTVGIAGAPGAVDTNSGGPSSTTGAGATVASCGTGMTEVSVGVPCASGASGRTGRHITTVVVCAGAALAALGFTRFTRRTIVAGAFTAALLGVGLAATLAGDALVAFLRWATGFFFAGATTGVHSTNESTDALRSTGFF